MPFIAENDLERALVKAAKEPAAVPEFYRLLLDSKLLVMGTAEGMDAASEEFSLSAGGKLNLVPGVKNGAKYLPVFSSLPRMQEFVTQGTPYLSLRGRDILNITRGKPVILNPASEYGKELSAQEALWLLDGPGAGIAHYSTDEERPAALVDMMTSVFKTHPDVSAAWMVKVGSDENRRPLVGIELDAASGGWPSLMQAIEKAAQAKLGGLVFDVDRVDPANPTAVTEALVKAKPFYVRSAPSLN